MGLDSVEFVMEVEDEFDIKARDATWESCRTVKDVVEVVHNVLKERAIFDSAVCPTARAFYECKQVLKERYGKGIRPRPGDSLNDLIPPLDRQVVLEKMSITIDALPPKMHAPLWVELLFKSVVWPSIVLTLAFVYILNRSIGSAVGAAVFVAIVLGLCWLCIPKSRFPRELETLGDVARGTRRGSTESMDYSHIVERVRKLAAEQVGMPIDQVLLESRFVEDIGMD